jgi:hypothetical protein
MKRQCLYGMQTLHRQTACCLTTYPIQTVLVPIVEAFMQRCLSFHQQVTIPEQARRLLGHAQYWQAFLKALNQSLS